MTDDQGSPVDLLTAYRRWRQREQCDDELAAAVKQARDALDAALARLGQP